MNLLFLSLVMALTICLHARNAEASFPLTLESQVGFHSGQYPHGIFRVRSTCYVLFHKTSATSLRVVMRDKDFKTKFDHHFENVDFAREFPFQRGSGFAYSRLGRGSNSIRFSGTYLERGDHLHDHLEGPYFDEMITSRFACAMMMGGREFYPYYKPDHLEILREVFSDVSDLY